MKNAVEHAKTLKKLLSELSQKVNPPSAANHSPLEHMVFAFLLCDSSYDQAELAYSKLLKHCVDLNDLRVSDVEEIVQVIGPRYRKAEERARRLKTALHAVYAKAHTMDMSYLDKQGKREVRTYLEGLPGVWPFVASYVALFGCGSHAIPLDEQLFQRMKSEGVVEPDATWPEAQSFLDHHIHAEEAAAAFHRLHAYGAGTVKWGGAKGRKLKNGNKTAPGKNKKSK